MKQTFAITNEMLEKWDYFYERAAREGALCEGLIGHPKDSTEEWFARQANTSSMRERASEPNRLGQILYFVQRDLFLARNSRYGVFTVLIKQDARGKLGERVTGHVFE